jgi:hypothetical protein
MPYDGLKEQLEELEQQKEEVKYIPLEPRENTSNVWLELGDSDDR